MCTCQTGIRPILVIQITARLTDDQMSHVRERLSGFQKIGWECLVVDGCTVGEVRAFGVPEIRLEEFDVLKEKLEKYLDSKA